MVRKASGDATSRRGSSQAVSAPKSRYAVTKRPKPRIALAIRAGRVAEPESHVVHRGLHCQAVGRCRLEGAKAKRVSDGEEHEDHSADSETE